MSRGFDIAVIEAVVLVLFGGAAYREWRRSPRAALLLGVACAYGLGLEILNMYVFGTYAYHPDFVRLFGAPLVIGPMWALILLSSMRLSDCLGVAAWARPLADGALCVLIDLGMDAVAIRLEYWRWNIPLDAGFYGVPADNLFAWICVGVCFSICARFAWRRKGAAALLLAAPAAYVLLLGAFVANGVFLRVTGLDGEDDRLLVFWVALSACALCTSLFRSERWMERVPSNPWLAVTRVAVHAYFLAAFFALGLHREFPSLLAIAVVAVAVELAVHVWARQLRGPSDRRRLAGGVLDARV